MSDKPPFDPIKACFYLIAAVLGFQGLVGLVGLVFCVYWGEQIVQGKFKCENIATELNQIMQGALAAALAFTAAFTKKDK
jgi:hypothetical protein